jgi:hypothetical protein
MGAPARSSTLFRCKPGGLATRAYSTDPCWRVPADSDEGIEEAAVAARYRVGESSLCRVELVDLDATGPDSKLLALDDALARLA